MDLPVPVVLASASATRRELLERIIEGFDVVPSRVVEERRGEEPPRLVVKLAEAKAREVAGRHPEALVIGADTVVVCRGEVIGKPSDRREATRMLRKLSRNPHTVFSGVCVVTPDGRERSFVCRTRIRMRPMSDAEVRRQVCRPDALSRAGGYDLRPQDPRVQSMDGLSSTVLGLPVEELARTLARLYPGCGGVDGSA
jgi:septum formation protein